MSVVVHVAALGLTGLGLLFCIISTSTKHWYEYSWNNKDFYMGLWEACVDSAVQSDCSSLIITGDGSNSDKFRAVHAFTIMAILGFAFAGLCLLLTFVKRLFLLVFLLAIIGAAVCQVIAMVIYTDLYGNITYVAQTGNFGWSFALGWAGFVLALISLVVGVVFKFTAKDRRENIGAGQGDVSQPIARSEPKSSLGQEVE